MSKRKKGVISYSIKHDIIMSYGLSIKKYQKSLHFEAFHCLSVTWNLFITEETYFLRPWMVIHTC